MSVSSSPGMLASRAGLNVRLPLEVLLLLLLRSWNLRLRQRSGSRGSWWRLAPWLTASLSHRRPASLPPMAQRSTDPALCALCHPHERAHAVRGWGRLARAGLHLCTTSSHEHPRAVPPHIPSTATLQRLKRESRPPQEKL